MKLFNKFTAALLVCALIVGSVGVMPVAAEDATDTAPMLLFREDFDEEVSLGADGLNFTGTTESGTNDYSQIIEGDNGYLKLQGVGTSDADKKLTYVEIPIENVPENTTIWVEMDICAMGSGVPQQTKILTDKVSIAAMKQGKVTLEDSSTVTILSRGKVSHLSYEIDLVNDKYYAYVGESDDAAYEGSYTKDAFEKIVIQMPEHKVNGEKYLQIDNVAVYASATKVDLFAEPTALTLNKTQITSMKIGDTEQLTAEVETTGIAPTVTWTSDDESVATVSNDGLVTAKKMGKATITAKAGKITATCVVTVGVTYILYKQDFETISTFEELGYSKGGVEGYTPELRTRNYNQYLFLETGLTTENYVTIPMENSYENETIWVEMDIYTAQHYEPKRFQIVANDSSNMSSAAPVLAFKNSTIRNPGDGNKSICPLDIDEWVRLSYKVNLETRTITAYMDGEPKYEYTYKENYMSICNYLKISIPVSTSDEGQMEGMGFCIDNLVVYVNEEQKDMFQPSIKGVNLGLEGNIAVKYHADLREVIANKRNDAYMKFTLPNGTTSTKKVSDITQDTSTGYYIFPCEVAAKEMTSVIKTQLFGEDDKALTEEISYTIYDNAKFIIDNSVESSEHYSEEYKNASSLAKALLNYGGYAQKYFGHNTSDLAYKNYQDESITSINADKLSNYKTVTVKKNDAIASFYGVSLSLKSETALNYYFTLAEGIDVQNLTFECDGKTLTPTRAGNMYCIKVEGIGAIDLDTFYTVTVTYGDETMSVSCCALVYAYTILSLSDDSTAYKNLSELKNVCRALYKYNRVAEQYKAGVLKLFYYNDFKEATRELDTVSKSSDCTVERVEDTSNSYLKIGFDFKFYDSSGSKGYYQPDFSGASSKEKLVLEMRLSKEDSDIPETVLQYRYTDTDSKNDLFNIIDNAVIVEDVTVATIMQGEWTKIGIQLDCETGIYTIYTYDDEKGVYEAKVTNMVNASAVPISYIRFTATRDSGVVLAKEGLLIDDIAIYEGTDFVDMSESEPLTAIKPETGVDTPIVYIGDSNFDETPTFTQSTIDAAIDLDNKIGSSSEANYCWKKDGGNVDGAEKMVQALYYLVLAARFDSNVAHSNGETTCVQSAVKKIEFLTTGGNEPYASVGPFWGHAILASAFALAKDTPAVYNALSADTKERMDCIMSALAIAANWGYNDVNDYNTGFDLRGNFGKAWNPNFRNAYLSVIISASMYFGAEELDEIFTTFSYDAYMSNFEAYGFSNMKSKWETLDNAKTLMEQGGTIEGLGSGKGVKHKFQYTYTDNGYNVTYDSEELIGLFTSLVDYTYAWKVRSDYGTPGGADYAYILSGEDSPYQGQMGMLREFAASDSKGMRSDLSYSYSSWAILVSVYTNMKLLGGWDSSTEDMKKLDQRMFVGNEDLLFKMENGYHSYSNGSAHEKRDFEVLKGHVFAEDIWKNLHYNQVQ